MPTSADPSEPGPNDRSSESPPPAPEAEDADGDLDDLPRPDHMQDNELRHE